MPVDVFAHPFYTGFASGRSSCLCRPASPMPETLRAVGRQSREWDRIDRIALRGEISAPAVVREQPVNGNVQKLAEALLALPTGQHTEHLKLVFPEPLVSEALRLARGETVLVFGDLRITFRADEAGYPVPAGGAELTVLALDRI